MKKLYYLIPLLCLACAPPPSNEPFANAFKVLDGKWQGIFHIYEDSRGQQANETQPKEISLEHLKSLPLTETMTLEVEQHYQSTSPYYQTVKIIDTYTKEDGTKEVVKSSGVNKVEKGKLWCIVDKPDEQIVHSGEWDGKNTIIWQRNIKKPLKIEYFKETVEADTYSIIGWGYYGDDDPKKSPKMWFYAAYKRVE